MAGSWWRCARPSAAQQQSAESAVLAHRPSCRGNSKCAGPGGHTTCRGDGAERPPHDESGQADRQPRDACQAASGVRMSGTSGMSLYYPRVRHEAPAVDPGFARTAKFARTSAAGPRSCVTQTDVQTPPPTSAAMAAAVQENNVALWLRELAEEGISGAVHSVMSNLRAKEEASRPKHPQQHVPTRGRLPSAATLPPPVARPLPSTGPRPGVLPLCTQVLAPNHQQVPVAQHRMTLPTPTPVGIATPSPVVVGFSGLPRVGQCVYTRVPEAAWSLRSPRHCPSAAPQTLYSRPSTPFPTGASTSPSLAGPAAQACWLPHRAWLCRLCEFRTELVANGPKLQCLVPALATPMLNARTGSLDVVRVWMPPTAIFMIRSDDIPPTSLPCLRPLYLYPFP
jgi:hypothetical protein